MNTLTPGIAMGCFEILAMLEREPVPLRELEKAFVKIAGVSTSDVIPVLLKLRWVEIEGAGLATPSLLGSRAMSIGNYEGRLRELLMNVIIEERPPWVQSIPYGRARVLRFLSRSLRQVFVEAELADGVSAEVVGFWDRLAAIARGETQNKKLELGREGERLTLAFEELRTGRSPQWVAIDNNADGYDVLSIVDANMSDLLNIEVKSTSFSQEGHFHVTRNEWEQADSSRHYVFHLWRLEKSRKPELAVVSANEVALHIPADQGVGNWESVAIPFSAFSGRFSAVSV